MPRFNPYRVSTSATRRNGLPGRRDFRASEWRRNIIHERARFHQHAQKSGESIEIVQPKPGRWYAESGFLGSVTTCHYDEAAWKVNCKSVGKL